MSPTKDITDAPSVTRVLCCDKSGKYFRIAQFSPRGISRLEGGRHVYRPRQQKTKHSSNRSCCRRRVRRPMSSLPFDRDDELRLQRAETHKHIAEPVDSLRMVGHVGVHENHVRARYDPQPVHVGGSKAHFARPRQNPHDLLPVQTLQERLGDGCHDTGLSISRRLSQVVENDQLAGKGGQLRDNAAYGQTGRYLLKPPCPQHTPHTQKLALDNERRGESPVASPPQLTSRQGCCPRPPRSRSQGG